jgi:ribonuclease D
MQIHLYTYDLSNNVFGKDSISENMCSVAVDTETMGLNLHRDRLCLIQFSMGDGNCHLVHFPEPIYNESPNVCALLASSQIQKIFHYARFDVAMLKVAFGFAPQNVYCTKIASKLVRTFTNQHSLRALCRDLLNIEISKDEQCSDWGASTLTAEQLRYAGVDVLHLHALKNALDALLTREGRMQLAQGCFNFLPFQAELDVLGNTISIFDHGS